MPTPLFKKGNKVAQGYGRPKGSGHVMICREWAEKKGWKQLINWAEGKDHKLGMGPDGKVHEVGPDLDLQFQATKTLIEYGYGRPPQGLDIKLDMTNVEIRRVCIEYSKLSDEELHTRLLEATKIDQIEAN